MEAWTDLYEELAQRITDNLPGDVAWVDLWHEQVSYLTEELPFPSPAVFIAFNTQGMDDKGLLGQEVDIQVDLYFFYETFSDTYQGAYNKAGAIDFLCTLTKLHKLFHGLSGTNFGTMRRVDMRREDSGDAGNLYRISFACKVTDNSAMKEFNDVEVNEVETENNAIDWPTQSEPEPLFILP